MTFHIGQHVVCVEDEETGWAPCAIKGCVYTIVELIAVGDGECNLQFAELYYDGDEKFYPGFRAECFRPLSESRLEIFRQMLVDPPKVEMDPVLRAYIEELA